MFRICVGTILAVSLAAFSVPLQAQHRGGSVGGGGTARSGAVGVRPAPQHPGNSIIGRPVTPFVNPPVTGFSRSPGFAPSRSFDRRGRSVVAVPGFVPTYGYYPYNYYSPFAGPVSIAPDPITQQGYAPDAYAPGAPVPVDDQGMSQTEADLSYQVGILTQQLEDLRQQQAAMQAQAAPQPAPQPVTPVVLIFRDGHRMELQNYAIVGQTLWVLDNRSSIKIPLSDLDLDATQRENRARGLRFSLPSR